MTNNTNLPLLEVKELTKSFYGNVVLDHVSFSLVGGEVLGLVGQNGAGKSTLVKILTGVYQRDSGEVLMQGRQVDLSSIKQANKSGISIVFQELSLAQNMTVADNIFVGQLPKNALGLVDKRELYERARKLIDRFQVDIRPDEQVKNLSVGKRQIVEILKAISRDPQLLILDEPTSSLEEAEIDILFNFIRQIKQNGYSIIYISHHMSEIFEIVDSILVLRDGHMVKRCAREELDVQALISLMIGQTYERADSSRHAIPESAPTVLSLAGLTGKGFTDVSLSVRKGEILGLAGIVGCGKDAIVKTVCGITPALGGKISLEGEDITLCKQYRAKEKGILFIPENRKTEGLFLNDSVINNLIECVLRKMRRGPFLDERKISALADKYIRDLSIKLSSRRQIVRYLSGGNQQKVLVSRCLADDPKLLVAMDPTRGIDVASKADIHKILHALSEAGLSVLLVSSELDELITMCDRILVVNSGRLTAEYAREHFDVKQILVSMHQHYGRE